jgi:hypothetical protein
MCRNIRTLYNFEPPTTEEEIRAAALQFVRKISGYNAPSVVNEAAFNRAGRRDQPRGDHLVGIAGNHGLPQGS